MKFSSIITNYSCCCWFVLSSSLWTVSFNHGVNAVDSTSVLETKNLKLLLDDDEELLITTAAAAEKTTYYSSTTTTKTTTKLDDDESSSQLHHRHLQMLPPGVDPFIGYLFLTVSTTS